MQVALGRVVVKEVAGGAALQYNQRPGVEQARRA